MQDYLGSIFDAAETIPRDANTALLIFDALAVILRVDVNVEGINSDVAVGVPMLANLLLSKKEAACGLAIRKPCLSWGAC